MTIEHFQINFEVSSVIKSYLDEHDTTKLRRDLIKNFPPQLECLDAHLVIKKSIEDNKDILWFSYTGELKTEKSSEIKGIISTTKQNILKIIEKFLDEQNLPYKLL